jgi:hypothetical protein
VLPFLSCKRTKIKTSTVQLLLEQSSYFTIMRKRQMTTNEKRKMERDEET